MFKLSKSETEKKITSKSVPVDFRIGDVYKMMPASRSYSNKPYYVAIKDIGEDFIETYIPEHHSLKIKYNSFEWEYHLPRMIYMGNDSKSKKLIHGQIQLVTNKK